MKFLCAPNFLILGGVLICFRFVILAPTLLVPSYLSVLQHYRPEQTASVLAWVALAELILAPLSALFLYKVDSRLVCALGFTLVALSCVVTSQLDPAWTGETFFGTQLVIAAGLSAGLTGLIATLLRSALAAGALKTPINILTLSCWLQTCRLFGAEVGKTLMSHFLKVQGDLHYSVLATRINGDWLTNERISQLAAQAANSSGSTEQSVRAGALVLSNSLKEQVALLSFSDAFVLIAIVGAVSVLSIGFITYSPPLVQEKQT